MKIKWYYFWLLAQASFWVGHFISLIMNNSVLFWMYPLYNKLMCYSGDLSSKYKLGVWNELPNKKDS